MNPASKADSPGPARWVFGLDDRRLLTLHRYLPYRPLPSLQHGALTARCTAADFEAALGELAPHVAIRWAAVRPGEGSSASHAMVARLALEALVDLDAAAVVFAVADLEAFDRAVAAPLAVIHRHGTARPDRPPLRVLAARALVGMDASVVETISSAAACGRLSLEHQSRRETSCALGAALDERRDAGGAETEVALAIATRAREAVSLGEALADHLQRQRSPRDQDAGAMWRELTIGVSSRLARTLDAVHALVGMEH